MMDSVIWKGEIFNNIHQQRSKLPTELLDLLIERGKLPESDQAKLPLPTEPPLQNAPTESDDLTVLAKLEKGRETDLNEVGYHTLADIAQANPDHLELIDGVSMEMALAWIDEASAIVEGTAD